MTNFTETISLLESPPPPRTSVVTSTAPFSTVAPPLTDSICLRSPFTLRQHYNERAKFTLVRPVHPIHAHVPFFLKDGHSDRKSVGLPYFEKGKACVHESSRPLGTDCPRVYAVYMLNCMSENGWISGNKTVMETSAENEPLLFFFGNSCHAGPVDVRTAVIRSLCPAKEWSIGHRSERKGRKAEKRRDGLFVRHITNVLTARLTPSVAPVRGCIRCRGVGSRCYICRFPIATLAV